MVPKSVLGSKPIRESKSVFMNTLLKTGSYSFKISSNSVKPVPMVSNRFLWSQNWFLWFQVPMVPKQVPIVSKLVPMVSKPVPMVSK